MDESGVNALSQLRLAFRSLAKSVEKALMTEMYPGAGDVTVKNYRALHVRAVELLPDDYYVREVLALEVPADAPDKQKLAAVSLQAGQMVDYLESLQRSEAKPMFTGPDLEEIRTMGRDLQDQILSVTRTTLKRALANIDITMQRPPEPPSPPVPPVPPDPPKAKRKIELDDEDDKPDDGLI